jgi:hypothetical protein
MLGQSNILVSKTDITFTMNSGSVKSMKLYLRSGPSSSLSGEGNIVPAENYTYNDSTKTITITTSNINSIVLDGHYYQFAFSVSDGIAESTRTEW